MKILITNDDGISSKLILLLYQAVKDLGHEVVVCAPDKNNSCVSQCLRYWEYNDNDIKEVSENFYSHPGTPADGIHYYLRHFNEKPDMVISGINIGLNAGIDVQYSGTIGAASEAINEGIPAIAISAYQNGILSSLTESLSIILDNVFKKKLYTTDFIYSFNIPYKLNDKEIVVAPLDCGKDYIESKYKKFESIPDADNHYIKNFGKFTDIYFLNRGLITLTPILVDRTNYKKMAELSNIFDN